ncbi:GTPase domain-containing protein [Tsukamurella pseudospumae]|uniref:G domain-containing protein n=1 Tax=Tsukamurella pseudospumae TaxID=239498 RepID=A0A137YXQ3_9ACTN|nr:GTPase domain-containing protein [Tsukamurella pseudospumae]KXO90717.1 hypothetical protein AXK61_07390 [Tsukamurella pseudospumae]
MNIDSAMHWYEEASGSDAAVNNWSAFAGTPGPVVTVLGSYDVGKSSLIRRLLVDASVSVPDWLTISARHETFEVNEVEVGGVRLRDTPGLAVEADDARGQSNTGLAVSAAAATDVLIVVVSPQLATAEADVLRALVARGWDPGTLWFVISRFDEAGVDPDSDPAGYRDLADRKQLELRTSLSLPEGVPVFVVAADGFQYASNDPSPDSSVWESNRGWDGMGALARALTAVPEDRARLRSAAEERYWRAIVRDHVEGIEAQIPEMEAAAHQAHLVEESTRAWREELGHLDAAAKAGLRGILTQTARDGYAADPDSWTAVGEALSRELDTWIDKESVDLDRFISDVNRSARTERQSPNWQKLDDLVTAALDYDVDDVDGPEIAERLQEYAPYVVQAIVVGIPLILHLREKKLAGLADLEAVVGAQKDRVHAVNSGAETVISAVAPLITAFVAGRAQARANREAWRLQVDEFIGKVKELALEQWSICTSEAATLIEIAGGGQAQLAAGLRSALEDACRTSAAGRLLLNEE